MEKHACAGKIMYSISGRYSNLEARGKNFQKIYVTWEKKRSGLGLHIFSQNQGVLQKKKKSSLPFALSFPYFHPKIRVFSKKKRSSLRIDLLFPYFSHKIMVISKKKGLHSESNCNLSIFVANFRCPLKMSISFTTPKLF